MATFLCSPESTARETAQTTGPQLRWISRDLCSRRRAGLVRLIGHAERRGRLVRRNKDL